MVWKIINNNIVKQKSMLHRFIISTIAAMALITIQAQELCTIKGKIKNDSLCYSKECIKKVYLTRIDEYDRFINIDSTKVKKGKYSFKYKMKQNEPVALYMITGFDNGGIQLFVEPGEINISTEKAAYPTKSIVNGTPNNDIYTQYKRIYENCIQEQLDTVEQLKKRYSNEWMDSEDGLRYRMREGALSIMKCNSERIKFILEHNYSPIAPLMAHREILPMLSNTYAEQLLNSMSVSLHKHPYYRAFKNAVRSRELKEGGELPDITIPLRDGTTAYLSDFRGKYVLLDFWASWCGPCTKEIPFLKQLYNETREQKEIFSIISFSIDTDEKAWKDAIATHEIDCEGWIHGSDLLGWGSPSAKMLGVEFIPHIILVDPDGRAISFTLRGEELVRRVKQILSGDKYYLNE